MENNRVKKPKNLKVYIPLILVILLVLGGGIVWYIDYTKYITTDDANVNSDNVAISSKMLGRINRELVEEGDSVKQGQLIAVLDSTDLIAQKNQAIAGKLQAEAAIGQAEAKYQFDIKNSKILEISLNKAQDDFDRAKTQHKGDVITQEQFDHAKKALEMAQAQLEAAHSQAAVSSAQIRSTHAAVASACAQINVIKTQLGNTTLYAPSEGVIGRRWLMPGDIAQAGQSIFTIVNDRKLWINIFLEETKMGSLKLGQPAIFTLDAFPGVTFTGKITTIGSNTAAQFALIPASNASGNFTKVTQRVQIKISIDGVADGGKLSDYRILSGMSAIVKIVR
ncbi:HlyD family secretion protein [Williamwhitmania taraxaci]|uniref:Membrane fusion protein, multidrug efflux system n=1 Tax=Williamwhitmania taraxaci TaxID=1640674 RepID=A0A1G6MJ30_9BACT|nr:HlyD family secretion protein [Williamwhitmania taraxaci]SDC55284.1 membrane fusion protein, multidrug efflux system [Williamwhitmania taraxaci]